MANQFTAGFNGVRGLDILMDASLSAGPYWLLFGASSSTVSNSARVSAATVAIPFVNGFFGRSIPLSGSVGQMGSVQDGKYGGFGAGSFTTAGGGTTDAIPFSNITAYGFTGTQLGIALNFQLLGAQFGA